MAAEALQALQHSFDQMAMGTYMSMCANVEPFSGLPTESIDDWLNQFRSVTNMGIPNAQAASLLKLKLKGDAKSFAESLTDAQIADYDQLQTLLTQNFHSPVHIAAARAQLRQEKWRVDDTPSIMYNRLKPLVLKIHAGATPLEKDSQLKQYLWERLPDQVVIMSTGHNFNTAAELRDFVTELLHTMQQRPTSVINAVSQYDATPEITKKIDVLTQQIQHIAAIQTPRDNLNPQPTSGPPTIFKSRKAKQTVQRVTSQSCHRCGKMGHIARDCFTNICSRCKRPGHVASKCQACYQCGRLGHVAQFCPQNNQYSNQEQRRDTGERISRQGEIERRTFRQQTSQQHDNHSRRQLDRSISPARQTFQRIPQQDLQRSPSRYDSSHSRDITPPPSVRFRLSSDHLPNVASFSTITDIQTSNQSVTETTANGLPEEMDTEGEREEHTKERDGDDQLHNDVFEDCLDRLSDNLLDSGTNGQTKNSTKLQKPAEDSGPVTVTVDTQTKQITEDGSELENQNSKKELRHVTRRRAGLS